MASFDGPHQRRLRRRTLDPFLIVALCCWFGWDGLIRLVTCARQQQVECDVDGTCTSMKENDGDNDDSNQNDSCGLYMAISSIPNAGWGLYAGRDLVANSTTDLEDWKDVMIQLVDTQSHNLALVHELLWNKGRSLMERSNPQLKERRIRALLQQHALLLDNYVWSSVETGAYYDADTVESIAPGLGMLANGHTGLFNLEQQVCDYTQFQTFVSSSNVSDQRRQQRRNPRVGASSYYQDCGVRITRDVPAGHELLAKYGDDWFMDRKDTFGDDVSYTMDYVSVDKLIQVWQQKVQQEEDGDAIYASWEKLLKDYDTVFPPGSRRILPKSAYDALRMDYSPDNTRNNSIAYLEIPDVIRSMEWLKQHGLCVDHIRVVNAAVIPTAQSTPSSQQLPWNAVPLDHERSAVARRFRPAGSLVAPAPLMHLSRDQLAMLLVDVSHSSSEENDTRSGRVVLWRGHQLLLNYCYGHPDSSILLFPYSPGVNLINHYLDNTTSTTTTTDERHPNVALRWSKSMTHPEWLEWNTTTVLEQNSTGLMMEFYAIRDIHEGDELLLDYGPAWQSAWDEHVQEWNRRLEQLDLASSVETAMTVLSNVGTKNDYLSAKEYYRECLDTIDLNSSHVECLAQIPSWTELRCLVRPSVVEAGEAGSKLDGDTVFDWTPLKGNTTMMDQSIPCHVLSKDGDTGTYIVQAELLVHNQTTETLTAPRTTRTIRNVPLTGFFLVDRRYTNNQLLRHAFRHEIALPEAMVPSAWRDLVYYEDDTNICGLYMAESAIPNSGLGMYTARPIQNGDRIFHGDVVVQVEDMELNTKLRHWMDKDFNFDENDWLLHNYYWNPKNSFGNYEAESVQSIIPGLGTFSYIYR